MVEVELGDVLRSRVGPKLFVRSVTHPKLDDLARIYLELGLDAVVPHVIEGIRTNGMEGVPTASRSMVSITSRSHLPPSPRTASWPSSAFPVAKHSSSGTPRLRNSARGSR